MSEREYLRLSARLIRGTDEWSLSLVDRLHNLAMVWVLAPADLKDKIESAFRRGLESGA